MPQVASAHLHDMLNYLNSHGVASHTEIVNPDRLKPVQKINPDKVKAMSNNPRSLDKPNLVDKNYTIVDGHHRWATAQALGQSIKVIRLNATFEKIRSLLSDYENTEYKGLKETTMRANSNTILLESISQAMQDVVHLLGSAQRIKIMAGATLVYSESANTITLVNIKKPSPVSHVVISYNEGKGLYDIDGYKLHLNGLEPVISRTDIYVDQILRTIEFMTGLSLRL